MKREVPPYAQDPKPEPQGKKPLPWTHMITSGAIGVTIGAIIMLGAAAIINANEPEPTATTVRVSNDEGIDGAIDYLISKDIFAFPDLVTSSEEVVCTALDAGKTGNEVAMELYRTIDKMDREDAMEMVAATAVYMCPEHIGQLPR